MQAAQTPMRDLLTTCLPWRSPAPEPITVTARRTFHGTRQRRIAQKIAAERKLDRPSAMARRWLLKADATADDRFRMTVQRLTRLIPGVLVLVSLILGAPDSPLFLSGYALLLAGFVAVMLGQSGVTGFCPLERMLKATGLS